MQPSPVTGLRVAGRTAAERCQCPERRPAGRWSTCQQRAVGAAREHAQRGRGPSITTAGVARDRIARACTTPALNTPGVLRRTGRARRRPAVAKAASGRRRRDPHGSPGQAAVTDGPRRPGAPGRRLPGDVRRAVEPARDHRARRPLAVRGVPTGSPAQRAVERGCAPARPRSRRAELQSVVDDVPDAARRRRSSRPSLVQDQRRAGRPRRCAERYACGPLAAGQDREYRARRRRARAKTFRCPRRGRGRPRPVRARGPRRPRCLEKAAGRSVVERAVGSDDEGVGGASAASCATVRAALAGAASARARAKRRAWRPREASAPTLTARSAPDHRSNVESAHAQGVLAAPDSASCPAGRIATK